MGYTFQQRVAPWMEKCFGPEISKDIVERNHRFLEEALELVQSLGCTQSEAHQLVDYVYGRPAGDTPQEAGGVMVTLAALCLACGLSMHEEGEIELARVWKKIDDIRAKQAAKPKHGPLPVDPAHDAFMNASFWYSALDPDDSSSDSPANVVHMQGYGVVAEVESSISAGRMFGFILPAASEADSDDDREYWFHSKEEATDELARLTDGNEDTL